MAETIRFTAGVSEIVALKFAEGKLVKGKFGEQMMYTCVDGRAFYLDPEPARDVEQELNELGIRTGYEFKLTKVKQSHGGHSFRVERVRDTGGHNVPERAAGALYESAPARTTSTNATPIVSPGVGAINFAPHAVTNNTSRMMACFMSAIDAVAEAQAYANRKGLGVTFTPENITSTALSCFINECKGGR